MLFDFSFSRFVTTWLIRLIYGAGMLIAGVVALGTVLVGFQNSTTSGVLALVFAPIVFVVLVLFLRVYLEIVIVIFRIAEHLREINERGRAQASTRTGAPTETSRD